MTRRATPAFAPTQVLTALIARNVPFVVVGALAAVAHGSPLPVAATEVAVAPGEAERPRLEEALADLGAVRSSASRSGDIAYDTSGGPLSVHTVAGHGALARRAVPMELAPGLMAPVASARDLMVRAMEATSTQERALIPVLSDILEVDAIGDHRTNE